MAGPEAAKPFLKRFEEELFIPRDANGEVNEKALDLADALANKYSRHPFFVGITLRGSQIRGFSIGDSDTDIQILYDSSDASYSDEALDSIYDDLQVSLPPRAKAHVRWLDIADKEAGLDGFQYGYTSLCELTFGPRVDEYRKRLSASLKELSEERRTKILEHIVYDLLYYETSRMPQMQDRVEAFRALTQEQLERIMSKRKTMWERRVREVFDL